MGLDLSTAMLAEAVPLGSPPHVLGVALALPFPQATLDRVTLITTLEFVSDPVRVLREAARVARLGLILGVLNRISLLVHGGANPPMVVCHQSRPGRDIDISCPS